jgi:hypothetical protein
MAEPGPYPQPRSEARVLQKEQLLRQFAVLGDLLSAGALLIDVRRTDYEGGTIRGSLNMPAQSFPMNMATLYRLCAGDGLSVISRVIFYCGGLIIPFSCCLWFLLCVLVTVYRSFCSSFIVYLSNLLGI